MLWAWRTDENYPSIIIKHLPYLFHCFVILNGVQYQLFSHTEELKITGEMNCADWSACLLFVFGIKRLFFS